MTLRHTVFFHLHATVAAHDPRLMDACRAEEDLALQAPEGQRWLFGPDRARRAGSPDFIGVGDFTSHDALTAFLALPAHAEAARLWAPLARFTVADLEI
jgi:hypothetical protein